MWDEDVLTEGDAFKVIFYDRRMGTWKIEYIAFRKNVLIPHRRLLSENLTRACLIFI